MTLARTRRRASILLAGLLVALFLCAGRADAQTTQIVFPPDTTMPIHPPVPLPVVIYLSTRQVNAPVSAPQPVPCPRHTKPRSDCTPASQR